MKKKPLEFGLLPGVVEKKKPLEYSMVTRPYDLRRLLI
jgi:hypothetical protein